MFLALCHDCEVVAVSSPARGSGVVWILERMQSNNYDLCKCFSSHLVILYDISYLHFGAGVNCRTQTKWKIVVHILDDGPVSYHVCFQSLISKAKCTSQ